MSGFESYLGRYPRREPAGVHRRASGEDREVAYSDGSRREAYVIECLASTEDRSVLSRELPARALDWSSRYHFEPARSFVVRPFFGRARGAPLRVVELGAGFGAISRYLGEEGHEVLAIEGSMNRARGCRLRCRELANVHVLQEDLFRLEPGLEADAVLSVGVLEYAPVMGEGGSHAAFLDRMVGMLSPTGVIFIAIENPLGLKYLSGCTEDHSARLFDSIQGYPFSRGARTLERRRLEALLRERGLVSRFYFPFPDYKLMRVLVSEEAPFAEYPSLARWAVDAPWEDYQTPRLHLFSDALAFPVFARNGLAGDLANSFVVMAARREEHLARFLPDAVALGYSAQPEAARVIETRVRGTGGGFRVEKRVEGPARATGPQDPFAWRLPEPLELLQGDRLDGELLAALAGDGTGAAPLLAELRARLEADFGGPSPGRLRGEALDATAWNCIRTPAGLVFFDLEWVSREPIRTELQLLRTLLGLLDRQGVALAPWLLSQGARTLGEGLGALGRLGGIAVTGPLVEELLDLEVGLQTFSRGIDPGVVRDGLRVLLARRVAWPMRLGPKGPPLLDDLGMGGDPKVPAALASLAAKDPEGFRDVKAALEAKDREISRLVAELEELRPLVGGTGMAIAARVLRTLRGVPGAKAMARALKKLLAGRAG